MDNLFGHHAKGADGMKQQQDNSLVILLSPGLNARWDVSEKGCEEPLATFDEKEDAYAYAIDLTKARPDATVLIEDKEGFSPLWTAADGLTLGSSSTGADR